MSTALLGAGVIAAMCAIASMPAALWVRLAGGAQSRPNFANILLGGWGGRVRVPAPFPQAQRPRFHPSTRAPSTIRPTAGRTASIAPVSVSEEGGSSLAIQRNWPLAQRESLLRRLVAFGSTYSLEVSPGEILGCSDARLQTRRQNLLEMMAQPLSNESEAPLPPLAPGSLVYVNMVRTEMSHFAHVIAASQTLSAASLTAVPHLPAARFTSAADFRAVLESMRNVGVQHLLVLGGNDLTERADKCAYKGGARELLAEELNNLRTSGVRGVAIAGHPDGHPAVRRNASATMALLVAKARPLLLAGIDVMVTSQFCLDVQNLIRWLHRTREELARVSSEVRSEAPEGESMGQLTFHIGIPGPTPRNTLKRIAKVCDVPSGPSVFIGPSQGAVGTGGIVSPDELVLGIAKYCEEEDVSSGEVVLHFYPFGGLANTLDLACKLRNGHWPLLPDSKQKSRNY